MAVDRILAGLRGVKSTGRDRWIACCPAHEDRMPSMTIRVVPDGRILMHCFAGCGTDDILGALGLTFSDLFPEPLTWEFLPRIHAPFSPIEALQCLTHESAVVALSASDVAEGKPIDIARMFTAAGRIASALEACHGR